MQDYADRWFQCNYNYVIFFSLGTVLDVKECTHEVYRSNFILKAAEWIAISEQLATGHKSFNLSTA